MVEEEYYEEIIGEFDLKKPLFRLFFLKNDEDLTVEVLEVEEINFTEIQKRLEAGESVFISCKNPQDLDPRQETREDPEESWYFPHL